MTYKVIIVMAMIFIACSESPNYPAYSPVDSVNIETVQSAGISFTVFGLNMCDSVKIVKYKDGYNVEVVDRICDTNVIINLGG